MKKATTSTPGKLMLFGEHAVMYGEPCIVTAIDQRLYVTISETIESGYIVEAPEVKNTQFIERGLKVFEKRYDSELSHIKVTTKSDFSSSYGFGSSSAVTVAILKALSVFFEKQLIDKELFDLAYKVVLEVQGVGSGFDIAAAVWGGTLLFKKGAEVCENLEIESLPLVVGYTGVKADTAMLIKEVAAKRERESEKINQLMQAIGDIVQQAELKLKQKDWERAGKLMDFNQEYLRGLGVSSEKLENLISAAKKEGAYGAKLSGAGGGDSMTALVSEEKRAGVERAIVQAGGEVLQVKCNVEGVRVEP